jgi:hypothetical protein
MYEYVFRASPLHQVCCCIILQQLDIIERSGDALIFTEASIGNNSTAGRCQEKDYKSKQDTGVHICERIRTGAADNHPRVSTENDLYITLETPPDPSQGFP